MKRWTFLDASDRLCLSAQELADLFGVSLASVRQARMRPGSQGFRSPPVGWESKFAAIARMKGRGLVELANDLEAAVRKT